MKKYVFLLSLVMATTIQTFYAQTQQGYVKTLGRPEKKGEALSGVTVRVKGEHNYVTSENDGTFSMLLANKKNGDAYSLQQVQKNDYELNESDIIGRKLAFSDKVPLTIVMVSSAQLQADKQRIENNAYKTAEKNYKAKYDLIEKQLKDNAITIEHYRKEIQGLQDKFEKYQLLIDGLAEHYAHTDYDELDEKDREINICIENGELERADSLIGVLERNMEALAKIDMQISQANDIIAQANEDMAAVLRQQEKDAEYLYQLYTIALAQFENEKAARYIEDRAKLDTTNFIWQTEAGQFAQDYLADYDKALDYFHRALRLAKTQHENNHEIILAYGKIGASCFKNGMFEEALSYCDTAKTLTKNNVSDPIANVYVFNNLGSIYFGLGNFEQSLEFFSQALSTLSSSSLTEKEFTGTLLNNIGVVLAKNGNYEGALSYYQRSLNIREAFLGKTHFLVGQVYNNIGDIYSKLGDYETALDNSKKGLEINLLSLGENHPDVALSYSNIGFYYLNLGDIPKALENCTKAMSIFDKAGMSNSLNAAKCYSNLGNAYHLNRDFDTSVSYMQKAIEVCEQLLPPIHYDIAEAHFNIGSVYYDKKMYFDAAEHYDKAIQIFEQINITEQQAYFIYNEAWGIYNEAGKAYDSQDDFPKAIMYYEKALHVLEDHLNNYKGSWVYENALKIIKENLEMSKKHNTQNK